MKKKRILVCSHWLEIGGAERALIGFLDCLSKSGHDIDLFLCRHSGPLMKYIPEGIHLLPEDKHAACIAIPMKDALRKGAFGIVLGRLCAKARTKYYHQKHPDNDSNVAIEYSHLETYRFVKKIGSAQHYDAVFSFLAPHYISASKTHAKKKIAWIHTDYLAISVDTQAGFHIWNQFDHIIAISQACSDSFLSLYPELRSKVIIAENPLPIQLIHTQASESSVSSEMPTDGSIRLLSVGRFCTAKNFDNVPDICARLVQAGLNVKWYLIGFGEDEALIRQKVKESNMENRVILLGKKDNPYPYIAACDLYVQPSRYEGKCVSVIEAQTLGKPVVITCYPTSSSQLEDGVDGVIVPTDNAGCAQGLASLLRDPEKMTRLAHNCRTRNYSNSAEAEKIYQLIKD